MLQSTIWLQLLPATSSVNQNPEAFAALGSQVRPRLGEGSCSVGMQAWEDLIRYATSRDRLQSART